ncbi:hypothetical protein LSUE1_G000994 [Lachnellula suecica]|uniref:OPA3-like protein n=1 Tax=Lachnellula suecica TaxID=602035 RepID=A0A8T9CC52_9HELO|nr:hypothetical protein LSUE1_G000994 [Lachnellula suecica]
MVPLPLFKFAALFVRHISKYGANWIKDQAHDHPKFRTIAARYGQTMHQVNMRMAVTLLKDKAAEKRAKEKAEAPTVKTEEQMRADEAKAKFDKKEAPKSIWRRKFRPLPENKAVDLFADVIGDSFILLVATSLILYEYIRAKGKPDPHAEKLAVLHEKMKELDQRENELENAEKERQIRVETLEQAVEEMRKASHKQKRRPVMFCTSLRKRSEWATLPAELLAAKQSKWKESSLETHDLAIPVPSKDDYQDWFRLLLLSSTDLQTLDPTMARIERLYHQTGGRQVGIVFLLQENISKGNATIAYMNLQSNLLSSSFEMPIIPLFSLQTLQDTLFKFQRQLIATRREKVVPRIKPATSLLPFCSLNPPIPEHPRNLLSDVFQSIGDLAQAATSRDGQAYIRNLISEPESAVAEDALRFWEQEYMTN